MPRSISTRTGDDGTTSLLFGQRVPKDHPQIEAVGTLDDLNAALGAVKPHLASDERSRAIHTLLTTVQKNLVAVMGEVACAETDAARYAASQFEKLADADLTRLDEAVASLEARGLNFSGWATPGANHYAAALELARVAARRSERRLVTLAANGRRLRAVVLQFINRLSDLLWLLAREAETQG